MAKTIWLALIILAGFVSAAVVAAADSGPSTAPVSGTDVSLGWSLVQAGEAEGLVQDDATNPATSQAHLLRIIVRKTAGPGEGRVGAASSVPIAVGEGEWLEVTFLGQSDRGTVGLVFSLESADGKVLARTTLPEIGRGGRRGGGPSTAPAAAAKYRVSLHARGSDPAGHLVITPIEPSRVWLGKIVITPRNG